MSDVTPHAAARQGTAATKPLVWSDYAILAGLLLAAFLLGISTVHRAAWSTTHRSDFTVYTAAAEAYLAGSDIYAAENRRGWMYMYLPVFAVAMVPFTWMSVAWAAGSWYVLSLLLLVHMLWLCADLALRLWPDTRLSRFQIALLVLPGLLWPVISGMARGQVSVLLAYLVTLGVWATVARRDWLAGGALAGAIVLKVFPLLFLGYLVLRGKWKTVGTTALSLAMLVYVLPGLAFGFRENERLVVRWATTVALSANRPDDSETHARYAQMIDPRIERNQSLNAVMIRLIAPDDELADKTGRERLASRVAKGVGLLMLLGTAWRCLVPRRGASISDRSIDHDEESRRFTLHASLVILLMLVLSPVAWVHSFAMLALPLAVAIAAAASPSTRRPHRANRWIRAYAAVPVATVAALAASQLHEWGALLWGTVAMWAVFLTAPEVRPPATVPRD